MNNIFDDLKYVLTLHFHKLANDNPCIFTHCDVERVLSIEIYAFTEFFSLSVLLNYCYFFFKVLSLFNTNFCLHKLYMSVLNQIYKHLNASLMQLKKIIFNI